MRLCVWPLFDSSTLHSSQSLSSSTSSSWSSTSSSMWVGSELNPLCASANEEQSDTYVDTAPLTGYEPKFFDDYHFSETTEIFIQESSSDTRPSNLHDWEISDYTIGRALSSPLFTQEREEPAGRRQAYLSPDKSLLSSQSLSVGHVRAGRLVNEFGSLISNVRENPCRDSENEQIRTLLGRQKEQILADCRAEIQKHEFQADDDRRSIQKLNGVIESQRGEVNRALEGDEHLRRDQKLLHEQKWKQNRDPREAHEKSLNEMKELKRFHGSTFDCGSFLSISSAHRWFSPQPDLGRYWAARGVPVREVAVSRTTVDSHPFLLCLHPLVDILAAIGRRWFWLLFTSHSPSTWSLAMLRSPSVCSVSTSSLDSRLYVSTGTRHFHRLLPCQTARFFCFWFVPQAGPARLLPCRAHPWKLSQVPSPVQSFRHPFQHGSQGALVQRGRHGNPGTGQWAQISRNVSLLRRILLGMIGGSFSGGCVPLSPAADRSTRMFVVLGTCRPRIAFDAPSELPVPFSSTPSCRNVPHRITPDGVPTCLATKWRAPKVDLEVKPGSKVSPAGGKRQVQHFLTQIVHKPLNSPSIGAFLPTGNLPSAPTKNLFQSCTACSTIQRISGWDGPMSSRRFDSALLFKVLVGTFTMLTLPAARWLLCFSLSLQGARGWWSCPLSSTSESLGPAWGLLALCHTSGMTVWLPRTFPRVSDTLCTPGCHTLLTRNRHCQGESALHLSPCEDRIAPLVCRRGSFDHHEECVVRWEVRWPFGPRLPLPTQRTVAVPQIQFLVRMAGVPVVTQRQTPQETIEETKVPKVVSQDRIPQRTAEQVMDIPVPQVVEEIIEVFKVFVQDRVQQRMMEQITETPAVSLDEEIMETSQTQMQ